MAAIALALFVGINCISTQNSSVAQILMAGLQVGVIAAFIGFGLSEILGQEAPVESFSPFFPEGPVGLLAAMGLTFIAFEGFEIIVQSSEEAREPSRVIPCCKSNEPQFAFFGGIRLQTPLPLVPCRGELRGGTTLSDPSVVGGASNVGSRRWLQT